MDGDRPTRQGPNSRPEDVALTKVAILDAAFPARRILGLIADKWMPVLLYCLAVREARRFNELQRQIPDISKKVLTEALRKLERDGLVERRTYGEVPPRTDYRLTPAGRTMREPIAWLCEWAEQNHLFLESIMASRTVASADPSSVNEGVDGPRPVSR